MPHQIYHRYCINTESLIIKCHTGFCVGFDSFKLVAVSGASGPVNYCDELPQFKFGGLTLKRPNMENGYSINSGIMSRNTVYVKHGLLMSLKIVLIEMSLCQKDA